MNTETAMQLHQVNNTLLDLDAIISEKYFDNPEHAALLKGINKLSVELIKLTKMVKEEITVYE